MGSELANPTITSESHMERGELTTTRYHCATRLLFYMAVNYIIIQVTKNAVLSSISILLVTQCLHPLLASRVITVPSKYLSYLCHLCYVLHAGRNSGLGRSVIGEYFVQAFTYLLHLSTMFGSLRKVKFRIFQALAACAFNNVRVQRDLFGAQNMH